jgi:sigma-E factor negative regulatory protein RseA
MKAKQTSEQVTWMGDRSECLSALFDGEALSPELDVLFKPGEVDGDVHARWRSYQVVSDALRKDASVTLRSPQSFLAGVMAGLPEDVDAAPLRLQSSEASVHVRSPAANDAVVRWKVLAGVASVAAVVAVSWGLMGGVPGAPVGGPAAGAQLASTKPAGSEAMALTQPVAVKTAQGTLIRDARLEQFLAEHRQYGGATALQMPAGFLRNATYEAAPQR